jgi:hypothetical protein
MNSENRINKSRKLIPVTKWNKHHSWPPIGGLRYLIFHAEENGFSSCLRRVGRTVLIDETRFFEWVDQLNGIEENSLLKEA